MPVTRPRVMRGAKMPERAPVSRQSTRGSAAMSDTSTGWRAPATTPWTPFPRGIASPRLRAHSPEAALMTNALASFSSTRATAHASNPTSSRSARSAYWSTAWRPSIAVDLLAKLARKATAFSGPPEADTPAAPLRSCAPRFPFTIVVVRAEAMPAPSVRIVGPACPVHSQAPHLRTANNEAERHCTFGFGNPADPVTSPVATIFGGPADPTKAAWLCVPALPRVCLYPPQTASGACPLGWRSFACRYCILATSGHQHNFIRVYR